MTGLRYIPLLLVCFCHSLWSQCSIEQDSIDSHFSVDIECHTLLLSKNLKITSQGKLTIPPGVMVMLAPEVTLEVEGELVIEGTKDAPVRMTCSVPNQQWDKIEVRRGSIEVKHTHFSHAQMAMRSLSSDFLIEHCEFDSTIVQDCVEFGWSKGKFVSNVLWGNPDLAKQDAVDCAGIYDSEFRSNRIFNFSDDGIDIGTESRSTRLDSNFISGSKSMGISVGESSTVEARHNILSDNFGAFQAHNLAQLTAINNTVYKCDWGIIAHHNGGSNTFGHAEIRNCIFSDLTNGVLDIQSGAQIEIHYSLCDSENMNGTGNLLSDPLFDTSEPLTFRLQKESPCVNTGDPDLNNNQIDYQTDSLDQDPDGTRMDIGARYFHQDPIGFHLTENNQPHATYQSRSGTWRIHSEEPYSVSLYDIHARLVKTWPLRKHGTSAELISTRVPEPGVYILRINTLHHSTSYKFTSL